MGNVGRIRPCCCLNMNLDLTWMVVCVRVFEPNAGRVLESGTKPPRPGIFISVVNGEQRGRWSEHGRESDAAKARLQMELQTPWTSKVQKIFSEAGRWGSRREVWGLCCCTRHVSSEGRASSSNWDRMDG